MNVDDAQRGHKLGRHLHAAKINIQADITENSLAAIIDLVAIETGNCCGSFTAWRHATPSFDRNRLS